MGVDVEAIFGAFEPSNPNDRESILTYLSSDLGNCLYLYLDIDVFGLDSDTISVWMQKDLDGGIVAVAMRYADSFQLYSRGDSFQDIDYEGLTALLRYFDPMRISAPAAIIRHLHPLLEGDFEDSYGVVMEMKKYRTMVNDSVCVAEASVGDIPDIVDVVLSDEVFSGSYELESMAQMFRNGYRDGTAAGFIVREDGKIVAHLGLSAIGRSFVIASYTVVRKEARGYPYGAFLDSHFINNVLPSLGKRGFSFMQEPRRIKLFELMGNPIVGEYGKLVKLMSR